MTRMILAAIIAYALIPADLTPKSNDKELSLDVTQMLDMVSSFVTDLSGFCLRNPQTCEKGQSLADEVGEKTLSTLEHFSENQAGGDKSIQPEPITPRSDIGETQ